MAKILPMIEHVVVVMLENRSLDNLLGWVYATDRPSLVLPPGSNPAFDGLRPDLWNPANPDFFSGAPPKRTFVTRSVSSPTIPDPDPQETFENVNYQLFGPQPPSPDPTWPMLGFLLNYATTGAKDPAQIMQAHSVDQVPVLASLARNYAVSDAWFASVPSQTWPNRAFVHAGTSNGHVDNGEVPNSANWDVATIFNVLDSIGISWNVYCGVRQVPPLTKAMFPRLLPHDANFHGFQAFKDACANSLLPRYSFIEPSFVIDPNDAHPPHDFNAAEQFLYEVWSAVSSSPAWNKTLLVITFDEHGGCYDHVPPPWNATPPDHGAPPGDMGFRFDRFGVRVPALVVSPWVAPGTVFRSDRSAPYDHTSILATLRDWLEIPPAQMLTSGRAAAAPTLAQVLSLASPRTDLPHVPAPASPAIAPAPSLAANDLQRSLVAVAARQLNLDPAAEAAGIQTRQHVLDFFSRLAQHPGDANATPAPSGTRQDG